MNQGFPLVCSPWHVRSSLFWSKIDYLSGFAGKKAPKVTEAFYRCLPVEGDISMSASSPDVFPVNTKVWYLRSSSSWCNGRLGFLWRRESDQYVVASNGTQRSKARTKAWCQHCAHAMQPPQCGPSIQHAGKRDWQRGHALCIYANDECTEIFIT